MHKLTHRGDKLQSTASNVIIIGLSSSLTNIKGECSHSALTSSFSFYSLPLVAQLGGLALIAPESCGNTTSASHPGIIVSLGVRRLEKKDGSAAQARCDGALWWSDSETSYLY